MATPMTNRDNAKGKSVRFVQCELGKYEMACDAAAQRVRAATTIAEVLRHQKGVSAHPVIRGVVRSVAGGARRRLEHASEDRARKIVEEHLSALGACVDRGAFQKMVGRHRAGEWRLLPGNFPRLARLVQIEAARIAHRLPPPAPAPEGVVEVDV